MVVVVVGNFEGLGMVEDHMDLLGDMTFVEMHLRST